MQKQLKTVRSEGPKALTKLSGDVILRELPADEILKYIAILIDRLAKLYQIQNWNAENSVILSEWIIENYSCEMLQTVDKILRHPPKSEGSNWRLTPDTIEKWMADELENVAMTREHWHQQKVHPVKVEPVEGLEEMYKEVKARRLQEWELEEEKRKIYKEKRQVQLAKWKATYTVDVLSIEDECKKRDEEYLRQTGQLQSSPSDQKQQL